MGKLRDFDNIQRNAYRMEAGKVIKALSTSETGLSNAEAIDRLKDFGPNELEERRGPGTVKLFIKQFANLLILLLLASATISALIGNIHDAIAISIAVLIVSTLGFIQEYRSEKSIYALKKLSPREVRVIREGKSRKIPAKELVPGDVIAINVGDIVSADARLIEVINLQVNESILTGESTPREKNTSPATTTVSVPERTSMVFSGTTVTYGSGKAVVTVTGKKTELGKISEIIQAIEGKRTPLQVKLDQFGKQLSIYAIIICLSVFVFGILRQGDILEMFTVAVSLAVAAIPEGLPIVVTITLALGVTRMARRKAIIRNLPAVETLGSTTVICSDKTGTLTQNEMTVQRLYTGNTYEVTGVGYEPKGRFLIEGREIKPLDNPDVSTLLKIGVLCNNAQIAESSEKGTHVIGQPTEGALLVAASKAGIDQAEIERQYRKIQEFPFDSQRKSMETIHAAPDRRILASIKGAPGFVIERCSRIYEDGRELPLDDSKRKEINNAHELMALEGMRVLAFAYKALQEKKKYTQKDVENELVFAGLMGIIDPPREGVKDAIRICKDMGVRVVMITGDAKETAVAIAENLGILRKEGKVISGIELENLGDGGFSKIVNDIDVYCRVEPKHKMRIINALKKHRHVVAMTGDGVNDAPALKSSDIGIVMGRSGADVAKESADMILVDDNFATIEGAVEEGKSIYNNIKNFLRFQLSTNVAALATIFTSTLAGLPLPLNPIQILWINILMDGPPAQSLSVEPLDKEVTKKPPRDPDESILSKEMVYGILFAALIMYAGTLALFKWQLSLGVNEHKARTMAFTLFVMFQMFNAFNCRSEGKSLFEIGIFSNKYVILAVAGSIIMQVGAVYLPILQNFFETVALNADEWVVIILISSTVFLADEIRKRVIRG